MEEITQMNQKMLVEGTRQQPQYAPDEPPPPYDGPDSDDDEDDDELAAEVERPVKVTINNSQAIRGTSNIVQTSPTSLADATKFSAMLLQAVKLINSAASTTHPVKVDLTINCGVTVIGDRNVVGNVGLKPKTPMDACTNPGAVRGDGVVAGAKRKADDDCEDEPEGKRIVVEGSPSAVDRD